ncbi:MULTISPECIES: MotA/TolQ/ExbB proton channel family protein [unclassified Microbulbifer]|uniref:MotA/TolQ/ExbB proton channel family protein n=1 Tax=unclassified Microbulbifer TaxID=2619833 RepID=UPI0027E44989|nr:MULTISPECIES: MotA/TolQ/ExbB proton channel family protein [unclassified Microbulbifer]
MSGLLHQMFLSLTPAVVTEGFILLMLSIFSLAMLLRFSGRGRDFVDQGPGFLTSLGILGTFVGIIIGLYEFSLEDIDRSIAELMEGLKTAFITSVVGLALSLLLRVFSRMLRLPSDPVQETATIDDLNRNLLVLRDSLDNFAQRSAVELVGQLEQVVAQFNQGLQAQFGNNLQSFCAQLSELEPALGAAAAEYREHAARVESWSQRCDESQRQLIDQQAVLAQVYDKIAELPHMYRGLDELLERQGQQAAQLNQLLDAQHESVRQLAELAPQLPPVIEQLSQGVAAAQQRVDENLSAISAQLESQGDALAERFRYLSAALENLQELDPEALQKLVGTSAQAHRESMRELAQMIATTHREMLQVLTEVIRKELQDTDISIRRQYEQMDKVMAEQVEQVLAAMGESLATISGQFTRDYRQLVAQMRRIQQRDLEYAG